MSLLDVARQVIGTLRVRNGGTGNIYGWGTGVVQPFVNRETSSMPVGSVVYVFKSGSIKLSPSAAYASVAGVVVGYYSGGDQNNVVVGAVAAGAVAAVMLSGVCRVLTSADVTLGNFATTGSTAGKAVDTATIAAGCFGQYVQNGAYATRPLVWVRLFGTSAGGGSSVTFGTPAVVLGTAAAAGSIDEVIRRDATIVAFDATVPTTIVPNDSAATGSAAKAARRDHTHGITLNGLFLVVLNAPTNGQQVDVVCPFAGTLTGWTLLGDASCTATMDVWKDTYANYPPTVGDTMVGGGGTKPNIAGPSTKGQASNVTGWTTSTFSAGDIIRFNVDAVSGATRLELALNYRRTSA